MDTADLMEAIAGKVSTIPGLAGASYPALNYVPESPWAMVRESAYGQTVYDKRRAGEQVVSASIDVVLLVTSSEKRPGDAAKLDRYIAPVLDLFDENLVGHISNAVDLPDVKRVWKEARVRRVPIRWGESSFCYAAVITLDAEFRRRVG
jgi:hypothetical protein